MEPPVSEPSEASTARLLTATALPLLEPPGTRSVSHGLSARPKTEVSPEEPIANSSMLVLPITTAPAARRRETAVAS